MLAGPHCSGGPYPRFIILGVRKASGALLLLLAGTAIPTALWADTARDSAVNPGNAAHLGAIEAPPPAHAEPLAEEPEGQPVHLEGETCELCGYPDDSCGILEFFGPLVITNHHPLTEMFLTPVPQAATVMPPGDASFTLRLDWVNNIIRELDSGVIYDVDFECIYATAEYRRALLGGELSARLPVSARSHGILDSIIADWHNAFGLRNGHRDDLPDYMYHYTIVTREGLVYNEEGDTYGVGDLALSYKYPLWNRDDGADAAALRVGLKAPLGDPDKALGSGNWDLQLGALYQRQLSSRLRGYLNADWVFIGEPDWENIGHQDIVVAVLGLEYAWRPGTTLVAQYRKHRNPLRTGNEEADKDAQELALGFNRRLGPNLVWSGGFNEDINPDTSSDFVMTTSFNWSF